MTVAATIAGVLCVLSLAAGLIARRLMARSLRPPPDDRHDGESAPVIMAPRRWSPVVRALLRHDGGVAVLAVWLSFLDAALALAAPWPLRVVVDYAVGHRPIPRSLAVLSGLPAAGVALVAAAAGLLLLLAGAVTGYLVTFLTAGVSEHMTVRLRAALVDRLLRARPREVAAVPLGELTSRLGGDAVRVSSTIAVIVETLVPEVALLVGMTVITAALDWRLTLIAVGVIPLYAVTARVRNRGLRGAQQAVDEGRSQPHGHALAHASGQERDQVAGDGPGQDQQQPRRRGGQRDPRGGQAAQHSERRRERVVSHRVVDHHLKRPGSGERQRRVEEGQPDRQDRHAAIVPQ